MSNTLGASFGYGITIPNGEDDEYEFDTSPGSYLAPFLGDSYGGESVDWYAALEALAERLHLHYEVAYLHDYSGGSVLFAEPVITSYESIHTFQKVPEISEIQIRSLEVAAETLGLPFQPTWVLVASYG